MISPDASLRPAHDADLACVRPVVHDARAHSVTRLGQQPAPMRDDDARRLASGRLRVAEIQGQTSEPGAQADPLWSDWVLEDSEGALGTQCLAFAEGQARLRSLSAKHLYTNAPTTETIAFHQRRGFTETHRGKADGFDRVYMAKPVT